MKAAKITLAGALLLWTGPVFAQPGDSEPSAILEIGGAGEWDLKGGPSYGPGLAVETTPIPDVLELEAGVTPFFSHGRTEWESDLLFKKPWTLSDTAEFMFGVGPTWSHTVSGGKSSDTAGATAALDFMFWPWAGRKVGWFMEPSYGYSFGAGHEQSLSMSAGLLIPLNL